MTEDQKDKLIAKMLDAPSSLSDEEVDMIMRDSELRDIHNMSSDIYSAVAPSPVIDMEQEWRMMRRRLPGRRPLMRRVMYAAAILFGIILASVTILKVVNGTRSTDNPAPLLTDAEPKESIDTTAYTPPVIPGPEIRNEAITRQEPRRKPRRKARRQVAENTATDPEIDIDEYLRIQQARIDNELAMQNAEIMEFELTNLRQLYDSGYGMDPEAAEELDDLINRITLQ